MKYPTLVLLSLLLISCMNESRPTYFSFDDYPTYPDAELWPLYTPEFTTFSIWSPIADEVKIKFYDNGTTGNSYDELNLKESKPGLWKITISENLKGKYYTFQIKQGDNWLNETPGIYAQAVGVNGNRAMVVDLESTNPEGWYSDKRPKISSPNQAIIYELHVRDLTIHDSAGSSYPGKFLGLAEKGTFGPEKTPTGLDHIKELGITHVHLLPAFDHYSIDETKLDSPQFNWGYDPKNYNVPEGSFSTDPYDGAIRIKEFKQMVKNFHDIGIGVILDVVYNHTGRTESSNFNQEVPGYYYRQRADGSFSDASACGNETSSERTMTRKFMVESVKYWSKEYHLDGFRFDLMGIHDIATMNQIASEVKKIDPSIFIYGEGWTAGASPLPENERATKANTYLMPQISAFSDDIRDGIKGSVFEEKSVGFVTGGTGLEPTIKFGIVGSINHPQLDYKAVNYSDTAWASKPWQAVSYVSCHDNQTLLDKLRVSRPNAADEDIIAMHKLANGIVLTSQGIPFLHAGVEMMRTKRGEHNSYNLPDNINQIDWNWKIQNHEVFDYYKDLISLRKNHPAFSMPDRQMVIENLKFLETKPGFVSYQISNNANGDKWSEILICYNANPANIEYTLEETWQLAVLGGKVDENGWTPKKGKIIIPKLSMLIAFQK